MWPFDRRSKREQDLARELQSHLDLEAEEQRAAGLSNDEARYAARRAFGNQTLTKENTRAAWGWTAFESLAQDLRYAFRSLRASPVFTCVAVASLALGIGANTAIFSFVDALLLKRLPVPEPQRLVALEELERGEVVNTVFSYPMIKSLDERNHVFDGIFGRYPVRANLAVDNATEPLRGELVTGGYFKTLQVKPALGRLLDDNDVETGAGNPVCVLSYPLWQTRFGADPHVLGRRLMLDAHPFTVVGVTEKGFRGPQMGSQIDLQIPASRARDFLRGPFASMWKSSGFAWLEPLARLKPGFSALRAQAAVNPIAKGLRLEYADPQKRSEIAAVSFRLIDGSQGVNVDTTYFKPVTILMAVVALVLLIACANVANLLLARASARAAEFAVRLSLGASRLRLIRQLMVESALLASGGAVLGTLLAFWMIRTLLIYLNAGRAGNGIHAVLDLPEIFYTILVSLLTTLLFGLLPAWHSAKQDVSSDLKKMRGNAGNAWVRKALIVAEIALSMVILFTAGLLTSTLSQLQTVDLGFDPSHVLSVDLDPSAAGYTPEQTERAFDDIQNRLRTQPWVKANSLAVVTPLEGSMISLDFELPGRAPKSTDVQTNFNMVGPDYFKTLSQRMLAGRDFNDHDLMNTQHVAIVNQLFVQQYMPGESPLGRRIKLQGGEIEIVGFVADSSYQTLREKKWPLVYLPIKQTQSSSYALLVRTTMPAAQASKAIKSTVHSVDPKLSVFSVEEMQETINGRIAPERIMSFLSTLFSALVTILCSMGIYGLIAYAVARRTREIGVRFAIGAQKSDVARLFFRDGFVLIALGVILGIPLALASARALKSLLFGVEPTDAFALSLAVGIFIFAGILASLLPVRKATRIEPAQALRYE